MGRSLGCLPEPSEAQGNMTTVLQPPLPVTGRVRAALNGHAPRACSRIFDISIDLGQPADLLRTITGWVADGSRRRVMYVNAHVLNQSTDRDDLRRALQGADLVYCDGYGVRVAARALELEVPHRMTGADWIWALAALCQADGRSLYLLGSEPGVARRRPGWRSGTRG